MSNRRRRLLYVWLRRRLLVGMTLAGLIALTVVVLERRDHGGIDGVRAIIPGPAAEAVGNASPPVFPAVPATAPPPDSAEPTPAVSAPGPSAGPVVTPSSTPAPTASPAPSPTPGPVALTTDRGGTALITLSAIVPGDSMTRTMAVRNTGTSAFRYTVAMTQAAGTLLWTDPSNGLQLTLRTPGGAVLYSGPPRGLGIVAAPNVVAAGASDDLVYDFALPVSAPNAFQSLVQDLTIVFTAAGLP